MPNKIPGSDVRQKKCVAKQYNEIGEAYLYGQREFFNKRESRATKFVTDSLPDDLSKLCILDFGCGDGGDIRRYEKRGASSVYGIDESIFMVSEAKKARTQGNISVAGIQKTKFEDDFFDIVVGKFCLHYLDNPDMAYREISRILKKHGVLIFVVHHPFKDLFKQNVKEYGRKEVVGMKLYKNQVPIHFPTHTLGEYLSRNFFKHFYVDNFTEEKSPEEYLDRYRLPGFMGIKAVKRSPLHTE